VLVDTSVWIEFFAKKSTVLTRADHQRLSEATRNGEITTILPIHAELFSGKLNAYRGLDVLFRDSIRFIDPDWRAPAGWERIIAVTQLAHRHRLRIPGIVDRMILVAAEQSGEILWTFDDPIAKIARHTSVRAR
jgi:predicted nucleic acid-binding protein